MKTTNRLASAALLLVCAWPGAAQENAASQKRADIVRLLELTQAQALGQQVSSAFVGQVTNALRAANPNIPQGALDALPEVVDEVVAENLPEFMQEVVVLYDAHFSHDEVRGLIGFYSSELGQKTIRVQPQITQESMAAGQAWGQSLGPEIQQRVRARLAEEGLSL